MFVHGYVADRYVEDQPLTAEVFTERGEYRTGDLGYLDDAGWLHFVARASEMIKTAGINVSPVEVESFLLSHPNVMAAGVVGRPDEALGQVVAAHVELVPGSGTSGDDLRAYCRAGIAGYKAPAEILIWDELPRTDTGKVDRRALREQTAT